MAVHLLQHPALRPGPRMWTGGIDRCAWYRVAVRLLGRADLRNQSVEVSLQLGVGMDAGAYEAPSSTLYGSVSSKG